MPLRRFLLPAFLAAFCFPQLGRGEVEWEPEANMDHQLFPSLILATAGHPNSVHRLVAGLGTPVEV